MDQQEKLQLKEAGVNVDAALERFMGNEAMLKKYLTRFLNEKTYESLLQAVKNDDQEAAKAAAHSLKSVCGTIGCEHMQELVINQEAAMRQGDWEKAKKLMPELQKTYDGICDALRKVFAA